MNWGFKPAQPRTRSRDLLSPFYPANFPGRRCQRNAIADSVVGNDFVEIQAQVVFFVLGWFDCRANLVCFG